MLETASGVKAFSVGKPSPVMLRAARKELALPTDQTVVIGDTMETDILGGVQLHYKTILVLSGSTRREDLARYAYRPDKIVESIADLDPVELEREFGAGDGWRFARSPPPFSPSPPQDRRGRGVLITLSEQGRIEPRSVGRNFDSCRRRGSFWLHELASATSLSLMCQGPTRLSLTHRRLMGFQVWAS